MVNPILAALLSVFPRLGPFYAGQFLPLAFVSLIVPSIVWLWNIYDAYQLAQ